ncbi:MAG: Ig-like domain-containing protein [Candidatus Symbiothrix sp.]|nr:Ig-like domain-containing protein [Candidatus Symbiothrix sp.]
MNKVVFLALALIIMSAASVNAQVRIGGTDDPNTSAILDLNAADTTTVGKLGLALPRVSLASTAAQLNGANPLNGTMVYNTNASMTNGQGAGIYFWNGGKWNALAPIVPVTGLTVTGDTLVGRNEDLQLDVTVTPVSASNQRVAWSSSNTNIATVDQRGLVYGKAVGSVTITAAAQDGSGKTGTKKVNVFAGAGVAKIYGNNIPYYTYPDSIGTWLSVNLLTTQGADSTISGSAYYRATTALTACPEGWALPEAGRARALCAYANTHPESNGATIFTQPTARVGFFDKNKNLLYYGVESRFWAADLIGQVDVFSDHLSYAASGGNDYIMVSVRCRRID